MICSKVAANFIIEEEDTQEILKEKHELKALLLKLVQV